MQTIKNIWVLARLFMVGVLYFVWLWFPIILAAVFFVEFLTGGTSEEIWDGFLKTFVAVPLMFLWVVLFHWADTRPKVGAFFYACLFPIESYRKHKEEKAALAKAVGEPYVSV